MHLLERSWSDALMPETYSYEDGVGLRLALILCLLWFPQHSASQPAQSGRLWRRANQRMGCSITRTSIFLTTHRPLC